MSYTTLVTVATCNLNQWALDFTGNVERVYESCVEAKQRGASYRLGPELELCGYGCEDHFLESDTFTHCWESLAELFNRGATDDLLCDFGMPILHNGTRYNCRVICLNKQILLIRPKTAMADNGNYRESRYFTPYTSKGFEPPSQHLLPAHLFEPFGQQYAPFGIQFLRCGDGTCIGVESCEELWTPEATHINLALHGVEIVGNGSGSHHELRKLNTRLELMVNATRKCGGVYLYANQRGCDGGRCYYDGGAMIVCNGQVLAQASQFGLQDVEVVTATVDLEDVRSYRASIPSFGMQTQTLDRRNTSSNYVLCSDAKPCYDPNGMDIKEPIPSETISLRSHLPEEECLLGPALWLWDYLRRSGAAGFFLPLSGGADSSSVATIVHAMCDLVTTAAQADPSGKIAQDCRRVCRMVDAPGDPLWVPPRSQDMSNRILHTTFMGTVNSSDATRSRAKRLSNSIGAYHLSINIDIVVDAMVKMFTLATGHTPRYSLHGGANAEDLALQNIQARLRMVTAYLFAQLLPLIRGKSGFLLVLASANVDEGLRGYMTKYDCSSGDLNPIGAISKTDLKRMLLFAAKKYDMSVLAEIAGAPPTAELRPNSSNAEGNGLDVEHSQKDEDEMGMTYEELSYFGRFRKLSRCGPVSMFNKLRVLWNHLPVVEVAAKVKRFFFYYSINRHKMCTITPAYHAEAYSPDDNRFDLRQFLYNTKWTRQFTAIDDLARRYSHNTSTRGLAPTLSTRAMPESPVIDRKKDL